ncbi:MAG: YbgA family protein [Desulfobacteraceae bacterium]|nr:YbgA family protein [Desulfobacteraceae bacterium]
MPLPKTTQQLWSHHKYSIQARDPNAYREIGGRVARCRKRENFAALACQLIEVSRRPPTAGGIRNTLLHMWGHVSGYYCIQGSAPIANWSLLRLLQETRKLACRNNEPYLMASTALSELGAWL